MSVKLGGMHHVQESWGVRNSKMICRLPSGEQKSVLSIPGINLGVIPNAGTHDIKTGKPLVGEDGCPEGGPLFIDVVLASLARNGR